MRYRLLVLVLLAGVLPASPVRAAEEGAPALPDSMAAIGDSITRAFDACCFYGEWPERSWSTGGNPNDPTRSHFERILAQNPAIQGNKYNDAVTGAKMADAPAQAERAVSQQVEYVTILMGGNDVCARSYGEMTPTDVFRAQFQETMDILTQGLPPDSLVFVASIPNVYRLWEIFHTDWQARLVWETAGICQAMLDTGNSEADRQAVLAREVTYNQALEEVCAQHANCRYDRGAVFRYRFRRSEVSHLDYFHPNDNGQRVIAAVTWATGWWGRTG